MIRTHLAPELAKLASRDPDLFLCRYPNSWLVWEPGEWRVAEAGAQTLPPEVEPITGHGKNGLICISLDVEEGPQFVKIGRAEECDVVLRDATVSRVHAGLAHDPSGRWYLVRMSAAFTVARRPLEVGVPSDLDDGDLLLLGAVMLRFHSPQGMLNRMVHYAWAHSDQSA